MTVTALRPILMGLAMGAMMIWMLHGILIGDSELAASALIAFVAAHVALALVGLCVLVFAARLSPGVRARMARLHRPSLRHMGQMLIGVAMAGGLIHLWLHGGLA